MVHKQFVLRQLAGSRKQAVVFVLCVALSMVTLVALNGFSDSVNRALLNDARQLHAADIIIRSNSPLSTEVTAAANALQQQGLVDIARLYEFYSVVRVMDDEASLLANLKVVEAGYPFYGQVELASGQAFHEALTAGSLIVEQALLDRLELQVGDSLRVGQVTLTIRDVLLAEPDRPVNFFSLGPRVFIAAVDLDRLDLVKKGSRVTYTQLLKVHDEQHLDRLASGLKNSAEEQEAVDTFRTAESGVKRFFDNFLFFLGLIGIFTLLLAGIGTQSALTAFLKEKDATIAIVKTMGATSRFITLHYLVVVAILGTLGTGLGLMFGFALQSFFPVLFAGLLPPNVVLDISVRAVLESLLLGFFVVGSFTFLPMYRLKELKPRFIFRKEYSRLQRGWPYYLTILAIFLLFVGAVLWQLQDVEVGLYFVLGVVALILITTAITELILFFLKKRRVKPLALRQALKGLFRPRNATRAIIITLAASLAVVFTIYLVEQNLDAAFVQSYPDDAPNVFFIDIQPDQVDAFSQTLGLETEYYPVIRANITAVNGQSVDRTQERQRRGDNLSRQFVLSYRDRLLSDEALLEGNSLYRRDWPGVQVSIMDDVRDVRHFNLGDTITFRVQGIPLEARVASVRTRTEESFQPLFDFILPEDAVKDIPQTVFSGVRVDQSQVAPLQNKIVAAFPNVSVIDVTAAIATFAGISGKLSKIIRFFTLFSIVAGVLIIISSVFATRLARIQEAVYFKVLGAKGKFVLQVFTLENLLLGLVSAGLALLLAQVAGWLISTQVFELTYKPFIGASLLMIGATMLLVTTVGLLASISILKKKPIIFLREQTEE